MKWGSVQQANILDNFRGERVQNLPTCRVHDSSFVEKQLFGIKLQNYIAVMVIKFNLIRVVKVYILGNFEKFPCKLRF